MKKTVTLLSISIFILIISSCRKTGKITSDSVINYQNSTFTTYTESSETRLAKIDLSDGRRFVFFGNRTVDGTPQRLSSYAVSTIEDSTNFDLVTFDEFGRFSKFILKNGASAIMDYSLEDSIIISIKVADTLVRITKPLSNRNIVKSSPSLPRSNVSSIGTLPLSSNGSINVWVTAFNYFDSTESNIENSSTEVYLQSTDATDFIPLHYNSNSGYYSVDLISAGYNFQDKDGSDTRGFIRKAIDFACSGPTTGSKIDDRNVFAIIDNTFCQKDNPLIAFYPELVAFCAAVELLDMGCNVYDIVHHVDEMIQLLVESAKTTNNRSYFARSFNQKLGFKNSEPKLFSVLTERAELYDLKIKYEYDEIPTSTFYDGNYDIGGIGYQLSFALYEGRNDGLVIIPEGVYTSKNQKSGSNLSIMTTFTYYHGIQGDPDYSDVRTYKFVGVINGRNYSGSVTASAEGYATPGFKGEGAFTTILR